MFRKIMFLSIRGVKYFFAGDALAFFVYAAWKFGIMNVLPLTILPLIFVGLSELARYGIRWESFGKKTVKFWIRAVVNFLIAVASLTGLIIAFMIDRTGAIILLSAVTLYAVLVVVEAVVRVWQAVLQFRCYLRVRRQKSV